MRNILKTLLILLFVAAASVAILFYWRNYPAPETQSTETLQQKAETKKESQISQNQIQGQPVEKEKEDAKKAKDQSKVPFTVQAPFANWSDPIFQNGCEEASMVMAMAWINGVAEIKPEDAQNQIKKISGFEDRKLGYNVDTDTEDMQIIFREYYHYDRIKPQKDISIEDIKKELKIGNIILVPTFGRALGNPNYKSPGPVTHMLVITGYDETKKEFITNDPGTKKGKNYRYNEKLLFDAIWEYPSGPILPEPPKGKLKKAIFIIEA